MAMELDHSFTVPVPPDQAWDVLLDVEKIAPCMPGATVESVEGDDVAGRLKVKVGPVSLTYKGTARFTDRDAANHSVLVEASGKETRGAGTASATVRATLRSHDGAESNGTGSGSGQTLVTLHTTLNVTGRPAQFGRGVIAEVGSRLIDKFADNLAQQLTGGATTAGEAAGAATAAPAAGEAAGATSSGSAAASGTGSLASASAPAAAAPPSAAAPSAAAPSAAARPGAGQPGPVQQREESLNLLSIAGPVVLKRLAPVVGAAAALALLTWGARRIFRGRKAA